jgi:hypothetical protein
LQGAGNQPLNQVKSQKDNENICREYKVEPEVVKNFERRDTATISERNHRVWQPHEEKETKQVKCCPQNLS